MLSSYPSLYPVEKIGDSPYPYPYPVNAGIPCENGDGFGQYPWGRVYLSSLVEWELLDEKKGNLVERSRINNKRKGRWFPLFLRMSVTN